MKPLAIAILYAAIETANYMFCASSLASTCHKYSYNYSLRNFLFDECVYVCVVMIVVGAIYTEKFIWQGKQMANTLYSLYIDLNGIVWQNGDVD